ncbi:MAG: EamA family transporter [Proteobacteria bacterium]|nr:EamA family transporter [Pseudomonadota bacterium]
MRQTAALARVSPYLLLTATVLFWALNWIFGRALRDDVPAYSLAFWRWVSAGALLLPFAWPHIVRGWPAIRGSWRIMLALGVLGTTFGNLATYMGLKYTTAVSGSILNSFVPVIIIAISWAFLGQRLRASQWAGVVISLVGVLSIVGRGDPMVILTLSLNVGDLWILGSMLLWALYTVGLRWRPAGLHPLGFLGATAIVGVVAMLPVYLWSLGEGLHITWTAGAVAGLAYVGLFPSVLGHIFWNNAVSRVGPNKAGMFMHLMPVFASLLAIAFLGEQLHLFHVAGMVMILGGIWLTSRGRNPEAAAGMEN